MFTTMRAAGLLGGLLILSADAALDLPLLAPEEGSSATRNIEFAVDLELQSLTIEQDGESQEIEVENTQEIRQSWVAKDTFGKSADGRILRFVRAFEDMTATMSQSSPDGEESEEEASELDGKQVVFAWDAEAEAYNRSYAEGFEGDDELLTELQDDLDLSYLLPKTELEEGATFELDLALLSEVLDFGGELHFRGEDEEEEDNSQQKAIKQAVDNLTGEATGTFKGVSGEDGARVYKLTFEFEVTGTGEASSEIEPPEEAPVAISGQESVSVEMTWKGTAEMTWDLEAKRLSAFTLEAELGMLLKNLAEMSVEGQGEMTFAQNIDLAGPFSIKINVE
jgi:hypothetical protein